MNEVIVKDAALLAHPGPEPKHHVECWYEPDELGWRCVAICPVRLAQARLL